MKREIFSESFHFHIDVSWGSPTDFTGQPFLMDVSSIVKSPWICLFEDISFRSTWRSLYKERAVVPDNVSTPDNIDFSRWETRGWERITMRGGRGWERGINLHPPRIVRSNGEANAGVVYTFADVLEVFISRREHSSTKLFGFERSRDDCRHDFREICLYTNV